MELLNHARALDTTSPDSKANQSRYSKDNCSNVPAACDDKGKMLVLSVSGDLCRWTCEPDPTYHRPPNKRSVIAGSLGAMVGVLLVLLGLIFVARYRRRRHERAIRQKDEFDLANELSHAPLLATPTNELGHKARSFIPKTKGARLSDPMDTGIYTPAPGEAGTELSMDIVERPPENDPTLFSEDGVVQYRQEKTSDAYPMLSYFSYFPDTDNATPPLLSPTQYDIPASPLSPPSRSMVRPQKLQRRNTGSSISHLPLLPEISASQHRSSYNMPKPSEDDITFDQFRPTNGTRYSSYNEGVDSMSSFGSGRRGTSNCI